MRMLIIALLIPIVAFSALGLLATFEPTEHALAWRIVYLVVIIAAAIGIGSQLRSVLNRW